MNPGSCGSYIYYGTNCCCSYCNESNILFLPVADRRHPCFPRPREHPSMIIWLTAWVSPRNISAIESKPSSLTAKPLMMQKTTVIKKGATLALSAAMPGLVGATFRKSGYYSTLRKAISHEQQVNVSHERPNRLHPETFQYDCPGAGTGTFRQGDPDQRPCVSGFHSVSEREI